jgi:hypothetical protein
MLGHLVSPLSTNNEQFYVECLKKNKLVLTLNIKDNRVDRTGGIHESEKKLRGLSPRANYTDRAAAAGRRS